MSEADRLPALERAIQEFIDAQAKDGDGSPGIVNNFFLAVSYTRIDTEGNQPFTRIYVASANPFGAIGVAEICVADARRDLDLP